MEKLKKIFLISAVILALSVSVMAWAQTMPKDEFLFELHLQDSFITGDEQFRLTEINLDEKYFILTHELGDDLHIIPLEIDLEIGFVFGLEGHPYEIVSFDDASIVLKHLYEFP
jgi:hypothetical protein